MADIVQTDKNDFSLEKVLAAAIKVPGVKINRARFLKKELIKYCSEEQIAEAIKNNPAKAGISKDIINKVSRQVINYETTKVTSLSVVASLPGGVAAVGAATADIVSYFAFILRTVQELAYLYGFKQFDLNDDEVDSETMNFILIFMGVMFSVQGAAQALHKVADIVAKQVAKKLAQKALTKGAVYPIIKKVAAKIGVHMTKQIFADSVASFVPVVGGVLSGGLTYAMFKPCCMKLRKNLASYNLCDPDYYREILEAEIINVTEIGEESHAEEPEK